MTEMALEQLFDAEFSRKLNNGQTRCWEDLSEQTRAAIGFGVEAVISEHEARKWQPIETAPKDGTKIIGIDGALVHTYRFLNGGWSIELRSAFLNTSAPDFWQPFHAPSKQGD